MSKTLAPASYQRLPRSTTKVQVVERLQEERAAIPAGADGSDTPLGDEECQHSPPIGSKAVVRTSDGKGDLPNRFCVTSGGCEPRHDVAKKPMQSKKKTSSIKPSSRSNGTDNAAEGGDVADNRADDKTNTRQNRMVYRAKRTACVYRARSVLYFDKSKDADEQELERVKAEAGHVGGAAIRDAAVSVERPHKKRSPASKQLDSLAFLNVLNDDLKDTAAPTSNRAKQRVNDASSVEAILTKTVPAAEPTMWWCDFSNIDCTPRKSAKRHKKKTSRRPVLGAAVGVRHAAAADARPTVGSGPVATVAVEPTSICA
ncbi:hypothetical protein ON010_g2419 [Phytophthora cinnamomi]|nr:hypothetical protein ON010_g2419 [Phytophthora cinnamomi]